MHVGKSVGEVVDVWYYKGVWNLGGIHANVDFDVGLGEIHDKINGVDVSIVHNGKSEDKVDGLLGDDGGICVPVVNKLD